MRILGCAACRLMWVLRALRVGAGARSCGSVFQTGLPFRQESGGLKPPAIERPSYGRGYIFCENTCWDGAYCMCGFGGSACRFMRV